MKSLPIVDTNTDTFYSWIVKVNGIINLCNTEVVTANNHANGAITTGKGYVIGTLGANTLVCDTIRGGNTVANGVLTITSNTVFSGNTNIFNAGVTLGANSLVHTQGTRVTTSNTDPQVADSFATSAYRSAKYVISVTDPVNLSYQSTEILLLHNGTTTQTTEYATLLTGSALATFSSDISTGNVRLLVTPLVANVEINIARQLVAT